jgi:hypothetical protein
MAPSTDWQNAAQPSTPPDAENLGGWDAEIKEPDPVPMAQPELKMASNDAAGIWKDF